jgi:integrase
MRGRFWYPACDEALGRRPRIHDLRHTAVALAIDQGAHAMAIKERMGHADITTTLGRYGHVLPSLEEQIVDGLEAARAEALAELVWPPRGPGVAPGV